MPENNGWISIYRKLQEHWLWQEKRVFSKAEAWIDILWEVQQKNEPEEVIIKNNILICNHAESLKSLETWSKRWGWNRTATHRFLKILEKCNMIVLKNETQTTRLTVLNYDKYQDKRNADETQMKRKRSKLETQANTDNNDNNSFNKLKEEEFEKTFKDFKEMRIKIKKSMTPRAEEMIKTKLEKLAPKNIDLKIKILEQSILKSWQDIFQINESFYQKSNNGISNNGDLHGIINGIDYDCVIGEFADGRKIYKGMK
jgi:hypothetical protein